MKKKICFFADWQIHTIRWCTHFSNAGYEVHLITLKPVEIPNVTVHLIDVGDINVSGGNWKVLFKYRKIKKLLKAISPDIFHALYATSYGITGALCGYKPYLITALGSDVLISPNQSKIYRFLLKFAFSKADAITAMSDHMKQVIVDMGVPADKVMTVPFGIDPHIFNKIGAMADSEKFTITSTRNFEEVYNIPHLIKAVALVKDRIPGIHVNLIGRGTLKGEYEALIKENNMEHLFTFFGKIPLEEVASVLNKSHLFVSVSLSDGNNISLNEAMACGPYSIATNIPANTQWITDKENGFLVEINDVSGLAEKIVEVYENYEILQVKAQPINDKIIFEKGLWSNNIKTVEEKYKHLIQQK